MEGGIDDLAKDDRLLIASDWCPVLPMRQAASVNHEVHRTFDYGFPADTKSPVLDLDDDQSWIHPSHLHNDSSARPDGLP